MISPYTSYINSICFLVPRDSSSCPVALGRCEAVCARRAGFRWKSYRNILTHSSLWSLVYIFRHDFVFPVPNVSLLKSHFSNEAFINLALFKCLSCFVLSSFCFSHHRMIKTFHPLVKIYLTIILRNRAEYHLILSRRGRRPSWLNQGIFRKIEQDNCFIIQQIPIEYHFQNEKNYGSMIKTLKASNT